MEKIKDISNDFFFDKFIKTKRILSYSELQKERENICQYCKDYRQAQKGIGFCRESECILTNLKGCKKFKINPIFKESD